MKRKRKTDGYSDQWSRIQFRFLILLSFTSLFFPPAHAEEKTFVHPGIYQTKADLDFMKQKVLDGEQPWKDAFEMVKKSISFDEQIKVEQHIVRGAFNSPCIGADNFERDANQAYQAALVWYISGEQKYADKAIEILNAWSPNIWDFDDNDWFGIHLASCLDVTISGCLVEANSSSGIYAEYLYDGCEHVTVTNNIIQYNDGFGFESYAGTKINSDGNQYTGNGELIQQEKISNEKILLMGKN